MESARMMKMATGNDSPLRQGARTGSRMVFGGYRGLRQRNSRSRFLFGGFYIYRDFWRREQVRGPHGESTRQGRALGGWVHPPPSWASRDSPPVTLRSSVFYIFQKKSPLIFSAFRELLFLHKNNNTVVLVKTASVWVSVGVKTGGSQVGGPELCV